MKDYNITFSKETTEMINSMIEGMKDRGYDALNTPLLIEGLIETENGRLKDFLEEQGVENAELPSAIDEAFYDYNCILDAMVEEKEEAEKKAEKKEMIKQEEKESESNDNKSKEKNIKKFTKEEKSKWLSQINMTFNIKDYKGKNMVIFLDSYMASVIEKVIKICIDEEAFVIEPGFFLVALVDSNNSEFKEFLKELEILAITAKTELTYEKLLAPQLIPENLPFLYNMADDIDITKPCEILKRDEEVDKLWNIMLKKNKKNAVIVGDAGVGKTALVEKITYEIGNKTSPEEFFDFNVISLDVNSLIAGTTYRGEAEQRIMDLINFLKEKDNVILFIDEVHTILGAGACREGEMDLANALKPILARGDTIVIGATTKNEYEQYFKKDAALNRRFEMVPVEEPKSRDVYEMIKNKIRSLSRYHKVKITKKTVEYIILIASCFAFEKKNPDKTLDLIDRAMVSAKRDGKTVVDTESILKNFNIYYKMWNGMSEEQKVQLAYHELGHYIVGKASGRLIDHEYLAVSLMPADGYIGVTVHEIDDAKVTFANLDYYIDLIASKLGGRAGESMYSQDFTSGASQDLIDATKIAFYVVSKLGMGNEKLKNKIYLNSSENPMFTEKATNKLNIETDKLIKKAYERANEILNENLDILETLVPILVKNKIMSEKELDIVWKKVVRERKK